MADDFHPLFSAKNRVVNSATRFFVFFPEKSYLRARLILSMKKVFQQKDIFYLILF